MSSKSRSVGACPRTRTKYIAHCFAILVTCSSAVHVCAHVTRVPTCEIAPPLRASAARAPGLPPGLVQFVNVAAAGWQESTPNRSQPPSTPGWPGPRRVRQVKVDLSPLTFTECRSASIGVRFRETEIGLGIASPKTLIGIVAATASITDNSRIGVGIVKPPVATQIALCAN